MSRTPPHQDFPESQHVASGNGYSDEQRTASLEELAGIVETLRSLPAWKLTPYTETIIEAERFLSSVESALVDAGHLELS